MKVQFYLRFHTTVGQTIFITGNTPDFGSGDARQSLAMEYLNADFWHLTISLGEESLSQLRYSYLIRYEDGTEIPECMADRFVDEASKNTEEIQVIDTWNHAGEFENAFFTAPFQKTLLRSGVSARIKKARQFTHVFKVKAPLLRKDEVICLLGSGPELGEWDTDSPVMLGRDEHWWIARVNLPKENFPVTYKYCVYNRKHKQIVQYESGENRWLFGDAQNNKLTILHDGFVHLPNNQWRGAGVSVPVFSLRSRDSFGVGEFNDVRILVDWAKKTGLHLVQILPVNDTSATHTWLDSYPYAAISAFALHPIYLNLETMAGRKFSQVLKPFRKIQKALNQLSEIDYEAVMKAKREAIDAIFAAQKDEWEQDPEYKQFFEEQKHWLVPYAAFCCLRDRYGTADFTRWASYSSYDKMAVAKFVSPRMKHYDAVALQYFIQYHLHRQLRETADYAHENGIVLKGDIPIGIYRHSCDAWVEPELYHMDMQAGAPPDDFAIRGQNWGFPTYNWERMAEDGFAWWKKRFEQMGSYFDAFRIDHILGFFRIWSIPMNAVDGIMGHFDPSLPLHLEEFRDNHTSFDHHRYVRPFINEAVIWELFGADSDTVKAQYLRNIGGGFFELLEAFDDQRKIEAHFEAAASGEDQGKFRDGLMWLVSNVILFEVEGSQGQLFHFRFGMENTSSFRYLDWDTQHKLRAMYINYFFGRQDHFWKENAMKKLPRLKQETNMLVCGEDLGLVPSSVPDVMKQLGILSLEIQRMPKDPQKEFFHPADAPYLSVITPSTHDMSTIRGWWEEDRTKTQRFYNQELGQWGDAPWFCEPWISRAIIIQHLHSPAMWSIFQLQDLLGMSETIRRENPHDERINVPANPKNYWRYRMHLTLEDLLKEKSFNDELKNYVHSSGRG